MDSIQNLIATQTEIPSVHGCYIITLLEPEKEEVISSDIDYMITSINVNAQLWLVYDNYKYLLD